ncbi:hypothetical protein BDQ94DRAFT_149305 [Aspergillus welwitschiae]|uniref:Uncharacterized protein n=1 Tax=Aspergillus welwitschiae TaxID=1341132 RepID=A0A3F3PTJ8_9EURO|nr:hypothetical protein BDQ94DRAFT_149305 [Aspergillus welwitschiae]RDH30267.1 hypothetical protein BDQ94DRAFT_149305 [Aspergillus welwitschiae]
MPHSASAEPGQEGRLIRNSRCRLYCLAPSEGMPTVFVQMRTNCAVDRQSLTGARRVKTRQCSINMTHGIFDF